MAFNPSAVNVSNRSSINSELEQGGGVDRQKYNLRSENRQRLNSEFKPNADTLYKIQIAGFGPQSDGRYERGYEANKTPEYIYGNYWEPSIAVYPLATFEAQLLTQSGEEGSIALKAFRQGNDAYSSTKNLLEAVLTQNNDDENFIEDDRGSLSINILT